MSVAAIVLATLGFCFSVLAVALTRRRRRELRVVQNAVLELDRQHELHAELTFRVGYLRGARDAQNGLAPDEWVPRAQVRWRELEEKLALARAEVGDDR